MDEFEEVTGTIEVPKNTGIEGFMSTVRQLLTFSRLQSIFIDSRGKVTFKRFVLQGEDAGSTNNNYGVDLESVRPSHVTRNADMIELTPPAGLPAPVVIGLLFDKSAQDKLRPLAFVVGAGSTLWQWYRFTTGHDLVDRSSFFGLPVLADRMVPDTALLLCSGYGRDAAFIDTRMSYKVEIPEYVMPETEVEVMP
jgi:hypothetical protein